MANTNAPFGFRMIRRLDGAAPTYQNNLRQIATTNTHAIGTGDVIISLSTGYIDISATTDTENLGIFIGCTYFDNTAGKTVWQPQWSGTASTPGPITAYIIDDPLAVFEAQSSGAAITIDSIGNNAKFTGNGTPNSLSGQSIAAVDASNIAVTSTFPFRIVGLSSKVGNDNTSSYNIVEVKLNNSEYLIPTGI